MHRWTSQPRQAAFLDATEYAVLFGGARGGGKTDALLAYALVMCKRHPGAQVLFVRRRFTDLSQPGAAIPRSQELIGQRGRWNSTQHRWTFPNGSVLKFGHLNDSAAITQYLGTQVDVLLLDQAEQLTEDEYRRLQGSVRATVPGLEPRVRLTANPGGVGHAWVKARFVDAAPPDTAYVVDDGGIQTSHRFVPSRVWDNQRLLERDPRYVQRLQALGGNLARAWLQGDWDQFEGQVFSSFRREQHVCAPFAIPHAWPRWHATDYGFHAPSCTLWAARSPSGQVYVYRERYETLATADQQALTVRLWSAGEPIRQALGDPAMWARESNGRSVAQQFQAAGVPLSPANNDRLAGLVKVQQYLAWSEGVPPRLQIFSSCANLLRTLPSLVYDPVHVEDVDSGGEDHAYDALRYLLMAVDNSQPAPGRQSYALRRATGGERR